MMVTIPEQIKSKQYAYPSNGSNHSPTSVIQIWGNRRAPVPTIRPLGPRKRVTFEATVRVREFSIQPPLSPLEETDIWYTKKDFAIFNAENKVLTKAIRLGSRTGNQQVRPEVPELRGLEDHLSLRANMEAKGRHNRAKTAVFIEQERQQREEQPSDPEAIRIASLKVTKQSTDIALYRGKMDFQRSLMPSAARFGTHTPVIRKAAGVDAEPRESAKLSLRQSESPRSSAIAPSADSRRFFENTSVCRTEQNACQRPGPVSQSSLRFRDAVKSKDKSPNPPKRVLAQSLRKPETDSPSSFAVGKPRRGKILVNP